ncbi:MIP18 family protein [Sphaceloma murrayae]|uniref:MIP18 family protein n=1 Tax=Sphaceloma murrayae TaxID=2082308 RepID=A0A2K1R0Q8_9PEZI|nr:MIP18 family protein [Sphaceloma murrayae]
MDDSKDNPLPQILNPSDLPTRRRPSTTTARKPGTLSLFADLLPQSDEGYFSSASTPSSGPSSPSSSPSTDAPEEIDTQEIYDLISTISDPEHPLSLGSLAVVNLSDIFITPPSSPSSKISTVTVLVTPTITHCSLATVIGLGVRVRLEQSLPPRFRIDVRIKEGTHSTADQVNKQLGDKERVAAAMENGTLVGVVRRMLETCV